MDDDVPGVGAGIALLRLFVGVEDHLDGVVAVAVDGELPALPVQAHDLFDELLFRFHRIAAPHGAVGQIIDDLVVRIAQVAGVALEAAVREELRRAEADLAVGGELRTGNVRVERVDVHARHAGQDLHAVAEQPEFVRPLQRAPVARGGEAVLRRGHALRRIRGASGFDAFHPVGFRGSGDMAEHGFACRGFFQHAVGVAVLVAADHPAHRVGGILRIIGLRQREAVAGGEVAGHVAQEHGMLWGDFINVRGQRVALVLKAGVVVTETENPFALRGFGGLRADQSLDLGDVLHAAHRGRGKIELRGRHEAGGDEVAVPVDETGEHGPPAQIRNHRMRIGKSHDFRVGADGEDGFPAYRERLRLTPSRIHSQDGPVAIYVCCRCHLKVSSLSYKLKTRFLPPPHVPGWSTSRQKPPATG